MALTRRTIASIDLDVAGLVPEMDDYAAVRRAQEKNAIVYEQEVKENARSLMVGTTTERDSDTPYQMRESRNRGDYPDSMVDYYNAEVDGLDIVADNPTSRADWFEFGTIAHPISASGPAPSGQRPRGVRGQFTRGARALKIPVGPGMGYRGRDVIFRESVWHPGQKATLVMEETMTGLLDVFADNIADELERELEG